MCAHVCMCESVHVCVHVSSLHAYVHGCLNPCLHACIAGWVWCMGKWVVHGVYTSVCIMCMY